MVSAVSSPLRALLWDVDGTLAETERDGHRIAFNAAFREASIALHWDAEEYGNRLAITGGKERIAAALNQLRGIAPDRAELERLQAAKQLHYSALVEAGAIQLKPGVAAMIAAANALNSSMLLPARTGRCTSANAASSVRRGSMTTSCAPFNTACLMRAPTTG